MLIRTGKVTSIARRIVLVKCLQPTISSISLKNTFCISNSKWNRNEFIPKLHKEIIDSQKSIQTESIESQTYFHKNEWEAAYVPQKTLFEFSKIDGDHQIKVLTQVKRCAPNDIANRSTLHQPQDQTKKLNYSQASVYIKKNGVGKSMAAQIAVFQGSVQLLGISFTTDQPSLSWQSSDYPGPDLSTLPKQIADEINQVFKGFGLTTEVLMNMVIHSSTRVDEIDLKWLSNLKEIWT